MKDCEKLSHRILRLLTPHLNIQVGQLDKSSKGGGGGGTFRANFFILNAMYVYTGMHVSSKQPILSWIPTHYLEPFDVSVQ